MKRVILFIGIIGFTILLSSCVKFSKIEDNFTDAGYTYSEKTSYVAEILLSEFRSDGVEVTIYAFNMPSKVAIVVEFADKDDIPTSLENNEVLQNLIAGFNSEDLIRRNFLVIPIATSEEDEQEIIDIFQD